jgi:hypothetical protein
MKYCNSTADLSIPSIKTLHHSPLPGRSFATECKTLSNITPLMRSVLTRRTILDMIPISTLLRRVEDLIRPGDRVPITDVKHRLKTTH